MNELNLSPSMVFAFHKRTGAPLLEAKRLLSGMEPELLARVMLAIEEQHGSEKPLFDPIESDSSYTQLIISVKEQVNEKVRLSNTLGRGSCFIVWNEIAEVLKRDHAIVWYSPKEMNPFITYD
jgi:hypothetical protein